MNLLEKIKPGIFCVDGVGRFIVLKVCSVGKQRIELDIYDCNHNAIDGISVSFIDDDYTSTFKVLVDACL